MFGHDATGDVLVVGGLPSDVHDAVATATSGRLDEAPDADAARDAVDATRHELAVYDVATAPGTPAVLHDAAPSVSVVAVAADRESARAALDAGADDFFVADAATDARLVAERFAAHASQPGRDARERVLETLNRTSQEFMTALDADSVAEILVDAASTVLGLPAVGCYLYDDDAGVLEPAALHRDVEDLFDEIPVFEAGNSLAWEVFASGETRVVENVPDAAHVYNPDTDIQSELFASLGDHGVFLSGSTEPDAFDAVDRRFVDILTANAAAALDRVRRESELRATEAELQAKNEELSDLAHANAVIRDVHRAVLDATTRPRVLAAACDHLVRTDRYRVAWVGTRRRAGEPLDVADAAGDAGAYVDGVATLVREGAATPATQALADGDPVSVQDVRRSDEWPAWRSTALGDGVQSVVALPLTARGVTYGVLEIGAGTPGGFASDEVAVLSELADAVAGALNAAEKTDALLSRPAVELELDVTNRRGPLTRLAERADAALTVDDVTARRDGAVALHAVTDDPDAVVDVAADLVGVRDASTAGAGSVTFVLADPDGLRVVAEQGARLDRVTADGERERYVVRVPSAERVRGFVEACRQRFDAVTLAQKHSVSAPQRHAADRLTDRQREVLEAAVDAGYFETPRRTSGEDIAADLGISPPTFHQHLRKALAAVLDGVLPDDA